MIDFENVVKAFGGIRAVSDVSFCVEQGKIVSIIGPNGAGKTTVFNLISGKLKPDAGRIVFNGKDIVGLRPSAICKEGLTRTFQVVKPFMNMTTIENVTIGALNWTNNIEQAEEYARKTLEKIGLSGKMNENVGNLTLSAKKRMELARILATRPKVMMLDEVMAGLNRVESKDMVELIRDLHKQEKLTFVIIEHALNIVMALSDKIIVLNQGKKIAEGTPKEVSEDQATIEAYIGRKRLAAHN